MNVLSYRNEWYRNAIRYEKTRAGSLDIDFTLELDFIDWLAAPSWHSHFTNEIFRSFRNTYST